MPSYRHEIQKETVDFMTDHEDMITEALKDESDWDRNDIRDLDQAFHENIVDRAYTLSDAAWILDNCDNEETDSGLWEGQKPRDAVCTQAAFSFANDVWERSEELYKEIKENFDEIVDNVDYDEDGLDLDDSEREELDLTANEKVVFSDQDGGFLIVNGEDDSYVRTVKLDGTIKHMSLVGKVDGKITAKDEGIDPLLLAVASALLTEGCYDNDMRDAVKNYAATVAFAKFEDEYDAKLEPLEPGSDEERHMIVRWLSANAEVGMRGGYPLGSSYIDARCGTGYGMPDQLDYVNLDRELGQRAPHLSGKSSREVETYYEETFGQKPDFRH
jgi:hypothetical protein